MGRRRDTSCCDGYNLQLAFIIKHLESIAESMAIQCVPEHMRWQWICKSVPPEGIDVFLYECVCSGPPVVVGQRHGDVYKRTLFQEDMEWLVRPMYWMHIPRNEYMKKREDTRWLAKQERN